MTLDLAPAIRSPFGGLVEEEAAACGGFVRGKVRDVIELSGGRLALVATDRISAFDHVLGTVPYRGQILTELSAWWFEQVSDIVASHVISVPDPNLTIVRSCTTLPVEVVVRGRLSGSTSTSLWKQYDAGVREIYGLPFPDGMAKNDPLREPVITPTTKAVHGAHDEPVTEREIVDRGLVDAERWNQVRTVALQLFERGRATAAEAGLVLVDTKYEFGTDDDGGLTLIDEVHTPDSSRFWRAATVERRLAEGREPENLDKEFVRLRYVEQGYHGHGTPSPIDPALAQATAHVYHEAFQALMGRPLRPAPYPASPRVLAAIRQLT